MTPSDSSRHAAPAQLAFLAGGGEMGERTRAFDWSRSPLGPVADWPQSLKTAVRIMLGSRYPMFVWWGRELIMLYNDAYIPVYGQRHPGALGQSGPAVWAEIWDEIRPLMEPVLDQGRACWEEERLLVMERNGYPEECYFTFSYSPIPDDRGGVGGIFCACTEDTHRVLGQRRLRTLRALADRAVQAKTAEGACRAAAATLAENPHDLPFTLLYLLDADGRRATLAGLTGLAPGTPASPAAVEIDAPDCPWPFRQAVEAGKAAEAHGLPGRFGPLPGGAWPESPQRAAVLPLARPGQLRLAGFVVAGVSPRLALDDDYRGFLDLLAGHVATAVANARAYEEEWRRAEALAELDRAKTAFFSNVSHEFRTPLTLMLGPVEDTLADAAEPPTPRQRERLEVAHRNALRLQKLVNTLLDFSRIEAGRVQAVYEPTDLAALTADLASSFRSACDRAGLRLVVSCPPLPEPVYVDRDMWEKVVLNLVSNAFKYTLAGRIEVALRAGDGSAELAVRDTGTGIPAEQVPRLFERFHRVEGARGRTQEGSGIGLALVRELVRLHGGEVRAESEAGRGSTFTVSVPLGTAHLPPDRIGAPRTLASTALGAAVFVEEALRWLPDAVVAPPAASPSVPANGQPRPATGPRPRILLADDNADMRDYVRRLLGDRYDVAAVADGLAALDAARLQPPDLILTDVMMPGLDGFALLRELRADDRTRGLPVLLLSARAGEEARVEGLRAGADDYLTKPFSARELLARVDAHLSLARLRRESEQAVRESEERFRSIFDQAIAGIAQTDLTGRFTQVNARYCAIVGRPAEELYGLRMTDITHPDDLARNLELFGRMVRGGGAPFVIEKRYLRPDGSHVWVSNSVSLVRDRDGQPKYTVAVSLDITDRKRAEAALAETRRKLDSALLAGEVGTFEWDVPDDRLWGDQNFARLFSIDLDATGAAPLADYIAAIHPDDRGPVAERVGRAVREGGEYEAEYRIASGGRERWVVARGKAERDATGRVVRFPGVVLDVTERKQAEAALQEADRRKDEFLALLAHELRNPLAPLRNGLQVMRLAGDRPESVAQVRTMMERQLAQLVRIVDDLLDVSRITRNKLELRRERVGLADVIQSAVETSRPVIEERGHALTVELPAGPVPLDADLTRLAQVFANLLINSARYTPSGGRIRLAAVRQDREVVVSVEDTGIGIPEESLGHVFDMFSQVDRTLERTTGGLGIGLSLVKGLVEMHGGTVAAHSQGEGKGSTFTVRLPLGDDRHRPLPEVPGDDQAAARRRRVLVVDDNRDSAETLAMYLRLTGNEVRTAHDGLEALELAGAYRPDLILMDVGMPRLNGLDATRRIREQPWGRGVVIIALTGWGQEGDRLRTTEAGCDGHLVKPVDPAALDQVLAALQPTPRG